MRPTWCSSSQAINPHGHCGWVREPVEPPGLGVPRALNANPMAALVWC